MAAYSKPTDVHAYLSPNSCTAPHLNQDGVSVAKTVGVRLRSLHSDDKDLLDSLNLYSGYLIARGYNEQSIKYHLASMANRDRIGLLKGQYKPSTNPVVPLVTDLHPAITCLSSFVPEIFAPVTKSDPLLQLLLPKSSLIVSYRKLPNLSRLLCYPDQNKFISGPSAQQQTGYVDSGCRCMVCKASKFGPFVQSPSLPGYKVKIPTTVSCSSGPSVVYYMVCKSGRPECARAHYVGMASEPPNKSKAMGARWSVHKYQHKNGIDQCRMTKHLITCHKGESAQDLISITILEACQTPDIARERETVWCYRLFSFYPCGLNIREERKNLLNVE